MFDRICWDCLEVAMEAHPVHLKRVLLLSCCPTGISESMFCNGPMREMKQQLDPMIQNKVTIHTGTSWDQFASQLVDHGMSREGVPKELGGNWSLADFLQWQELRARSEWNLPIGLSLFQLAGRYSIPCNKNAACISEEEKAIRQRRMEVIHSRRKRSRAQVQVQALQEQCSDLKKERKALLREGRELEELEQQAQAIIAAQE